MDRTIRGVLVIVCALVLLAVATEGMARMGRKPVVQGPVGRGTSASYTCLGDACTCKGMDDCNDMVDDGVCMGGITCDANEVCSCDYFEPIPLNRPRKDYRGFRK